MGSQQLSLVTLDFARGGVRNDIRAGAVCNGK